MPSTTNFGWTTPADTDLVKDGAAAIRTLGNGVDASFVDLKGGTTGQILSKNSNTDLDFTWIANDQGDITAVTAGTGLTGGGTAGAVTLTNDMATTITASGDIVVGTGSGTYDNLPIGTTGQVLTADTTVSPYKVKWATPSSGGITLLSTTTLSGSSTTISSIDQGYTNLFVFCSTITFSSGAALRVKVNNAANMICNGMQASTTFNNYDGYINFTGVSGPTGTNWKGIWLGLYNYTETDVGLTGGGIYESTPVSVYGGSNAGAVTSLVFTSQAGTSTFSAGTVKIYGSK